MLLLKRESSSLLAPLSPSKQQLSLLLSWVCAASSVEAQQFSGSIFIIQFARPSPLRRAEERKLTLHLAFTSTFFPFFESNCSQIYQDIVKENDAMISEIGFGNGNLSSSLSMRNECFSLSSSVLSVSKTSQRFTGVCHSLELLPQDTHLDPQRSQEAKNLLCWPFLWLKTKV